MRRARSELHRMRRSLLVLMSVAALTALALPAEAKPYTYSDPKDMPANAGLDIVGVTYSTEGVINVRKVRGRTVRTYQPTRLFATMTTAGAPVDEPGVKYIVEAQAESCGAVVFTYSPAAAADVVGAAQLRVACGGPPGTAGGNTLFLDPQFAIKGSKLIWSVPLKSLPKNVRAGGLLYGFKAHVDVTDPALALWGFETFGDGVLDKAADDGDWEIS